ncbi:uncharacterized protein PAC_19792 [Phialocephala subalpina]|uniref:Uncharacterized protein n=1 Tax=Phialocephala subalpina TaxID=576137 RepID=A0A1L7XXT8_9HELO|nr:uncharacterized protein PAC_19792 [Phialocephala subalpina]
MVRFRLAAAGQPYSDTIPACVMTCASVVTPLASTTGRNKGVASLPSTNHFAPRTPYSLGQRKGRAVSGGTPEDESLDSAT